MKPVAAKEKQVRPLQRLLQDRSINVSMMTEVMTKVERQSTSLLCDLKIFVDSLDQQRRRIDLPDCDDTLTTSAATTTSYSTSDEHQNNLLSELSNGLIDMLQSLKSAWCVATRCLEVMETSAEI